MPLLFKNYSLAEDTYLLIRLLRLSSFRETQEY